jgi:CheY-like chemotaxis protein
LVELMNGEIGIDSDFGRGSTAWFTATLPRVAEAAREPDIDREIGPPIEDAEPAIRILVVDDVDTNLEIAESYLRDCGYQVDCVGGGQEAIDALQSARYDLVLMDNQMPGMDGMTATRRIRALPSPFRDVPIIAMTADVLPRQVRAFLEAGMNDHIGKPIDRAKLHNNILRWLPSAKGEAVRHRMNSQAFDRLKFDEFVVVAGDEKARRVVDKFLNHLGDAFKSTWDESRREAHSLINTAGVLGLDTFVECCRRAVDLGTFVDAAGERTALDDLQSAQAAARQTIAAQIYPRMRFDRSRASA